MLELWGGGVVLEGGGSKMGEKAFVLFFEEDVLRLICGYVPQC